MVAIVPFLRVIRMRISSTTAARGMWLITRYQVHHNWRHGSNVMKSAQDDRLLSANDVINLIFKMAPRLIKRVYISGIFTQQRAISLAFSKSNDIMNNTDIMCWPTTAHSKVSIVIHDKSMIFKKQSLSPTTELICKTNFYEIFNLEYLKRCNSQILVALMAFKTRHQHFYP